MIYSADNMTEIPQHIVKYGHRWNLFDYSDVDPRLKTASKAKSFAKAFENNPTNKMRGLKAIVHPIETKIRTTPGGKYRVLYVIYYRNTK